MRNTLCSLASRALAGVVALGLAGALTVSVGSATQATAAARIPTDIRVATYNVRSVSLDKTDGEQRPWRERRAGVIANIMGENVDVIGVQEVNPSKHFASRLVAGKNQFQDLRLGLNAAGGAYALTNAYAFNCRKPSTSYRCKKKNRGASHAERILYNTRTLALVTAGKYKYQAVSGSQGQSYLAWAVLRSLATGSEFLFTTTHLDPKDESIRRAQWSEMITTINAVKGTRPVVVTGDFNTQKHSAMAEHFLPAMYNNGYGDTLGQRARQHELATPRAQVTVNAWMNTANKFQRDVRSWSQWNRPERPGNNIDWIFASNSLPVREYKVVANWDPNTWQLNGVIPSDHNMVRATVTLP